MKQTKSKCGRVIVAAAMIAACEINSAVADVVRVYDVDDYVQDGIVLHFDGIRNAGAGLSHDSTRRTWKNLVDGQPDASIIGTGKGYWTNSLGFFFEGLDRNSYAMLDSGITLGSNVTVQIAVDVDPSKQTGGEQGTKRRTAYFPAIAVCAESTRSTPAREIRNRRSVS